MEHGGGEVLGRMHLAFYPKNLLRTGNRHVVEPGIAVVREAGAQPRQRRGGEEHAACAAMQVQAEVSLLVSDGERFRRKDALDVGVALKNRGKPWLDDHGQGEVGTVLFEEMNGWSRENAVSE